ncbi:sporulation transcriptional regulator SpoIIID [Hominiventricola aquisgranensis]|uniref:Sporulation transcriptional regulator SpoIIID n=1 Tax=Hominiventricola aquisgranensis TaxID=3133164 RepID=A0ABV1I3L1_9FIRM
MKEYIEERAVSIANYIIDHNATVRQTAKKFGISKSTVHMVVTIRNDIKAKSYGKLNRTETRALSVDIGSAFSIMSKNSSLFTMCV